MFILYTISLFIQLYYSLSISVNQEMERSECDRPFTSTKIDFGALKFKCGDDGKEILSKLDKWSSDERAKAEDQLRRSLPPGWTLSQDAPVLCVGQQDARRIEAEIELLSAVSNYEEYQKARQGALARIDGFDTYRAEQEQHRPDAKNLTDAEAELLEVSWQDQVLKRYIYFKTRRSYIYDHIFKYFEKMILTERCMDYVNGYNHVVKYLNASDWPSSSVYGDEFPRYLFLLVQHLSFDPELLYTILDQIKNLVERNEANSRFYPDLYDKIAIYAGRPQRFATFFSCVDGQFQPMNGVEDASLVDARRAKYGLPPLSEKRQRYPDQC